MKIPKWNTIHKMLMPSFYPKEKAITIYTEDKFTDKAFYEILMERVLDNKVELNNIIQLGPKQTVIERSIDSLKRNENCLFIVDSDISIMDDSDIETANLLPLKRYCIENYLICLNGIVKLLYTRTGKPKEDIKESLKLNKFILANGKLIMKLYYRYYISQQLNCGYGFANFSTLKNPTGPPEKIENSIVNQEIRNIEVIIKNKLKEIGFNNFGQEFTRRLKEVKGNNPISIDTVLKNISGKSQLLPLLNIKLRQLDSTISSVSNDRLKRELAEKVDIEPLTYIKEKALTLI